MYTTTKPYIPPEDIPSILDEIRLVLENKEMLTMGRHVQEFERQFSEYVGTKYGIATNSCTTGLESILRAINVKGHEVVLPTQTFIATGSSVVNAGGIPIFCDINTYDYNASFNSIKEHVTPKTKAVILVHFGGLINQDIWEIKEYCEDRNLYLIEDCAHAHGATIDSTKAGNIGDVACFSFFATKIITTGEGGMVTTNNEELYQIISSLRNRGIDINSKYEIFSRIGSNYRMPEINAIIGLSQLNHLDEFLMHRRTIAKIYDQYLEELEDQGYVEMIKRPKNVENSFWRYTIKLNKAEERNLLKESLLKKDIKIDWPYDPPLHLQPVFREMYGISEGWLPIAESEMKRHICLPMNMNITQSGAESIIKKISEEIKNL